MILSDKPLNLVIKQEFAEQILNGRKTYELRVIGSNLAHKLFRGEYNDANMVKYTQIRFQLGYTKKYFITEMKRQILVNFLAMKVLPATVLTEPIDIDDAIKNPEKYKDGERLNVALGFSDDYVDSLPKDDQHDIIHAIFLLGKPIEVCV